MASRIGIRSLLLGALVASLLAIPGAAVAAPMLDGEFPVSSIDANNKLTTGPDGNIWVTLNAADKDVAKITPGGAVTEYDLEVENAMGIVALGDSLWISRASGVTKFSPADPEGTKEPTDTPTVSGFTSITVGPDGNLWVAASEKLIKFPPAKPDEFQATNVAELSPRDIDTAGSLLAIADFNGRVVTATTAAVTTDYKLAGGSQGVAGGPGGQVAFSQQGQEPRELGLLTPPGPPLTTSVPGADPFGVAFGPDGAYWFAEFNGNALARLTTDNQMTTPVSFPAGAGPRQITPGPGNTLWVTLETTKKVARVSGVDPAAVPELISAPAAFEPRTRIRSGPKGRVAMSRKASQWRVRFRFDSPDAKARFECRLKRLPRKKIATTSKWKRRLARYRRCNSPRTYKLKPGRYRFEVRARLDGVVDSTPAKRSFRIVRKRRR